MRGLNKVLAVALWGYVEAPVDLVAYFFLEARKVERRASI